VTETGGRRPDRFWTYLLLLAAGGIALRLLYVYVIAPDVRGIGDWRYFHEQANLIARGKGFIDPTDYALFGRQTAAAGHPPLWPLLLSGVSKLGFTGFHAHRAAGAVLGGGTIVVMGLLGRRLAGARTGLLAAGIYTFDPLVVGADGSLMSECLYGLLVAVVLFAAYRLYDSPSVREAAFLGAAVGLAALVRAEALLYVPLLALPLALRPPDLRRPALVATLVAFGLVVGPWTVRNAIVFDRPVAISNNGSQAMVGANCPATYHGRDTGLWHIECISPQQPTENQAQAAVRWTKEGLGYMRDHPGDMPRVMSIRVLRTWDLYQPWRMVAFAEGRDPDIERAGVVVYWLLLPLAIAGLLVMRARGRQFWIMLAPFAVVILVSVFFYGTPRFRHAADIAIIALAAVSVDAALRRWLPRRSPAGPAG
jgi:4-amino-4-deoxy-L-arabinose transferase-like glycosyltransferase